MDWSSLIPWVCSSLNAANVSELTAWTEAEIYNYAEEALHDIGGRFLLIGEYDTSTALVVGQASYAVPNLHIATIFAAASGAALKPSTVAEVEALDDAWQSAANGTPTRWIGNALGLSTIAVYPPPAAGGTLGLIFQKHPPDLTPGSPTVAMPAPIGDYLAVKAVAAARSRLGEMAMPDTAKALDALGAVYERAMLAYWGMGS